MSSPTLQAAPPPEPPHNSEAEENLLATILGDSDGASVIRKCNEAGLSAADFFDQNHQTVFSAMLELSRKGVPTETSHVAVALRDRKQLDDIGGNAFLVKLSAKVSTTAREKEFIEAVRETARRRELIATAKSACEELYSGHGRNVADVSTMLEEFIGKRVRPARPAGFTVWKPSQFLEYTPPADSVIVGDSILERGKWTSLVGIGGLGKTRWALFLAICQIVGRDCCDLGVSGRPLRWLILSTENGLRRWKSDLSTMFSTLSNSERAAVESHLRIMALTNDEDGDLNAGNPAAMAALAATLKTQAPDVIVFDPFAELIDGDENKTEDVVGTLRTLRQIVRKSAPTAAVLLIHHARTGAGNIVQAGDNYSAGNFGRGAKALYSAVRAELQLAPGDRDDPSRIVLACGKNSDGPKFTARGIVFDPETFTYSTDPTFDLDAWRADVTGQRTGKSCSIADAANAVRALAPAVGDEAKTKDIVEEMQKATDAGERTCKSRLREAVQQGYLLKVRGRPGFYRLGPKPCTPKPRN